ncbi:MAG: GNAT family N-acetyltransferase [Firmicutes bacterium]|nr:GNAT family N-acetyltransferase [Bacillota bacterium]
MEKNYLKAEDYPDGLECDAWDACSELFIAKNNSAIIATIRLIKESPLGFPIESLFDIERPANTKSFAEVSRLIIHPKYRKLGPIITLGLYKTIFNYSERHGISHWFAILDNRLHRTFRRYGFVFEQLAEPKFCFGDITSPYLLSLEQAHGTVKAKNINLYNYFVKDTKPPKLMHNI